ncbi:MAG TPA: hypothetical protein VEW03_12575 [Longimicrobiaceae bacterium]|nr:hypothetical protein [Longimicrobiaceae bacterium]
MSTGKHPIQLHSPRTRGVRAAVVLAALVAAACGPARRPAPPPAPLPPPPPPPPAFTAAEVWTREPGLVLRSDSAPTTLPYVFMRLQVLRVDSAGLLVRCLVCRGAPTGWIDSTRVAYAPAPPREAARLGLADFALAVRDAAQRGDIATLRALMARDFVHSLSGGEGVLEAVGAWRQHRANDLRRLPFLLDRGIVIVPGTPVWAAPPEYATQPAYTDLRAGFRRGPDGWEWLFLVRPGP